MNAIKAAILEGTKDADARAKLATFPGRYFQVAYETCDDPSDRASVLHRLVDLYGARVEQLRRQNDARDAELAAGRRRHLCALPTPTSEGA